MSHTLLLHRVSRFALVACVLLLGLRPAFAQDVEVPELTLQSIFASTTFFGEGFQGGRWAEEGPVIRYIESDRQTGATHLISYNLETGERSRLIDGSNLQKPDDSGLIRIQGYEWSADRSKVLIYTDSERVWRYPTQGFYYVVNLENGDVTPISDRDEGFQMFAKFNPAGDRVAFVRQRNIFMVDLTTMEETQLTFDGEDGGIINGTFDWVYEEEFSLRDGFSWSPDGRHIAFFQLDESATREYQMVDIRPLYPDIFRYRYPKAGEDNSEIRIGVIDTPSSGKIGDMRFFDTATWGTDDPDTEYLVLMDWTPDIDGEYFVWMMRMNRDQNDLDLIYGHPETAETRIVLNEKEDTYIEVETGFSDVDMGKITYLDDDEHFIWRSDRSGYSHLYLYRNDGTLVRNLTEGEWDVSAFHGIDERADVIYVTATIESPLERHLYSISYSSDGEPRRITDDAGWHSINTSADLSYFIDTYSNVTTPSVTTLRRINGDAVTVLQGNEALIGRLQALGLPSAEWIEAPAADGTPLYGYLIKPRDFDESREYPLLIHTYGGPGSQSARNAWLGQQYIWHHWLAEEHGILVAVVDNRGTGGRGKEFKAQTYRQLGILEAEDKVAIARHLGAESFIDEDRIGIWGWSYGGYLSLLAMLYEDGPETFKLGVAVAPVTSWRFYDTIYTERYLSTPQNNPDGYDLGSPITYANRMADDQHMLIVHGDHDDNVHVQNAIAMADALIAANKQFDMMIYPGKDHGIAGGLTRLHLFTMISNFIVDNL